MKRSRRDEGVGVVKVFRDCLSPVHVGNVG